MGQPAAPLVEGRVQDDTLVLKIHADQVRDPQTSTALQGEMKTLVDQQEASNCVIDFSGVRFMGSIGFLALMGLRRHCPDARMLLCGLSQTLREGFQACNLIATDGNNTKAMFEVADTTEDAVLSLAK